MAKSSWTTQFIRPGFVGHEQVVFAHNQDDTGSWAEETMTLPLDAIRGVTWQQLDEAKWQRRAIEVELSVEALFKATATRGKQK